MEFSYRPRFQRLCAVGCWTGGPRQGRHRLELSTRVGIFLAGAVIAPKNLSLLLLMLVGIAFGLSTSSLWVITQRLAGPEAAGRWTGMQNFFGNLVGPIVPIVTGVLLQRTGQSFWPFLIVTFMLWTGALSWIFVIGQVEPVEWSPATAVALETGVHPA